MNPGSKMNSAVGNQTLDKIQQEIKESLEREEELKREYTKIATYNGNNTNGVISNNLEHSNGNIKVNGMALHNNNNNNIVSKDSKRHIFLRAKSSPLPVITNGDTSISNDSNNSNSFRRFTPTTTKGVMQKFLKMRGKLSLTTMRPTKSMSEDTTTWSSDYSRTFQPARVPLEKGKTIRNGFVPAEEKMKRELLEFQAREAELRKERRKSQPDLMAALENERIESSLLKSAKSVAQLYNSCETLDEDACSSGQSSLKPSRSLAQLCDAPDEDIEVPGTYSLIMQFESMKNQQDRS